MTTGTELTIEVTIACVHSTELQYNLRTNKPMVSLGFRDSLWIFFSRRIFISRTLPSRCQPAARVWMLMLVFNFKGLQGGFGHFWCFSPKITEIILPRLFYLLLELALFFFSDGLENPHSFRSSKERWVCSFAGIPPGFRTIANKQNGFFTFHI